MKFYNRKKELNTINEWVNLSKKSTQVGVIFGRRRIGKTRLIKEALSKKNYLYFFIERKPITELLSDFKEAIAELADLPSGIQFQDLTAFLQLIVQIAEKKQLILVFDEFQNFRYIDPKVFGIFQQWIDEIKDNKGLTIIFIGSMFGLMKKIFTEYKEPLYGRLTGQINLKPLSPIIEKEILADLGIYTPENLLKFHIIFGGIPRYYDLLSDRINMIHTPMDAIKQLIVSPYSILKEEGKAVLMEEFGKKFMVYFSILQAISSGYHTRNQISGASGLNYNQLSPYLSSLEKHYELIERRTPIFSNKEQSKTSAFYIRDNFLAFWFRYLHKYSRLVEIEAYDRLNDIISKDFTIFEGTGFESLVMKLLIALNGNSNWQFSFDDIGRYWDRMNREIDIIFINHIEKYIFFGECKVNGNRVNKKMWQTLTQKSSHILQKHQKYQAIYGAFVVKNVEKAFQKGCIYSLKDLLEIIH